MTDTLRQFLLDLNSAWPKGDLDALAEFYHPDVVLLPPDFGSPITGRDAVVSSYSEFLGAAVLHDFILTEIDVYSFKSSRKHTQPSTHMAHVYFDIDYSLDGQRFREQGLEIYTIVSDGADHRIVWRSQTVLDSTPTDESEPG